MGDLASDRSFHEEKLLSLVQTVITATAGQRVLTVNRITLMNVGAWVLPAAPPHIERDAVHSLVLERVERLLLPLDAAFRIRRQEAALLPFRRRCIVRREGPAVSWRNWRPRNSITDELIQ